MLGITAPPPSKPGPRPPTPGNSPRLPARSLASNPPVPPASLELAIAHTSFRSSAARRCWPQSTRRRIATANARAHVHPHLAHLAHLAHILWHGTCTPCVCRMHEQGAKFLLRNVREWQARCSFGLPPARSAACWRADSCVEWLTCWWAIRCSACWLVCSAAPLSSCLTASVRHILCWAAGPWHFSRGCCKSSPCVSSTRGGDL